VTLTVADGGLAEFVPHQVTNATVIITVIGFESKILQFLWIDCLLQLSRRHGAAAGGHLVHQR
jgi:hypothetical protein